MSRKLSYMLRHNPSQFNVELLKGGWAPVKDVLSALNISFSDLKQIVDSDSKGRYSFSLEDTLIRANQGHSIDIDLGLTPTKPPKYLYHGTVEKFMHLIEESGLQKMARHHVHLSADIDTATTVASRRNTDNVLLKIRAADMYGDNFVFFVTENNVWLTDNVPYDYIERV